MENNNNHRFYVFVIMVFSALSIFCFCCLFHLNSLSYENQLYQNDVQNAARSFSVDDDPSFCRLRLEE